MEGFIIIQFNQVSKNYGATKALDSIDLTIEKGEIHSLIGENGAGKSTLIKILCGVVNKDSGDIYYEGKKILDFRPYSLLQIGISAAFQEMSLFNNLTVAQNLRVATLPQKKDFTINWKKEKEETEEFLDSLGIENVKSDTPVSYLNPSQKQLLEIVKSILRQPNVLCLDEPTSSLAEKELAILLRLLQQLKKNQTTVIFVSHKLEEVLQVSDRITVLRDGKKVETLINKNLNESILFSLMVGEKGIRQTQRRHFQGKEKLLVVNDLSDSKKIKQISFELSKGEILGLAGLVGAGRSELAQTIFGLKHRQQGSIYFEGKLLPSNLTPSEAIEKGIIYLPEDRKELGLYLDLNLCYNTSACSLNQITKREIINFKKEIDIVQKLLTKLGVRYKTHRQKAFSLSGGNQQKLLFGKSLFANPKILILDEPTRGVDVGSKREIYQLILNLVNTSETSIILISSEIEEICLLSDRVLVMKDGMLIKEFRGEEINERTITACYLQS